MDTITHVLTGAVMSGPAKEKLGWVGPAALLAGSFVPDIDLVLEFFGGDVYFRYHRVFTNSVLGIITLSLLTALVIRLFSGRADFRVVWGLVLAAYCMHVFMDLTNSYGCKLLWPFSDRWYALDSVFVIDPWITGILIIGLVAMFLKARPFTVAAVCFTLLFSYWGLRLYLHSRAVDYFKAQSPAAVKVGAFPGPVNPFIWHMVAEEKDRFEAGWYNLMTGAWKGRAAYGKQPENEAVALARNTRTVRDFLCFARFPYVSSERAGDGWMVYIQDLRFSFRPGDKRFVVTVKVRDDGKIEESGFKF